MSDYKQEGNRYTAIFLKDDDGLFVRLPFDIVRFNTDTNPQAKREIVPSGTDEGKVFERIWVVREQPWSKKVGFGGLS